MTFIGHGLLMQRPLEIYEEMLRPLGVRWERTQDSLTVEGKLQSGQYMLRGDVSSQFITGLLLALPQLPGNSVIRITTKLESRAYVELTRRVQSAFVIESFWKDAQTLIVPGGQRPLPGLRACGERTGATGVLSHRGLSVQRRAAHAARP